MNLSEYASYDGLGLAELVREGHVTAEELVDVSLKAFDRLNPELNFLVADTEHVARQALASGLPSGPFTGVPFLKKDLGPPCAGVPQSSGCRLTENMVGDMDSELYKRFKASGLVVVGRSAVPCMGIAPTTESVLTGATRNPWNPDHMVGGSSGGAACAVAAGVVPVAHASDSGGSTRSPAFCCGTVGLKPSRGLIPVSDDEWEPGFGLSASGATTRTMRDLAAIYDIIAGSEPGAKIRVQKPNPSFTDSLHQLPANLRVAVSTVSPAGNSVHKDCQDAAKIAAETLEAHGHQVDETEPNFDWDELLDAVNVLFSTQVAQSIPLIERVTGRTATPETVETAILVLYEHGKSLSATDLAQAFQRCKRISRIADDFFDSYDVLVTPVCAVPPPKLGVLDANASVLTARSWLQQCGEFSAFTPLFNITGQPAISLPLHMTPTGLPVGVQMAASQGGDRLLMQLGAFFERALPWADRRPPIHVAN